MHLDLFYELSVPDFGGRDEARVFEDTLAELELADRLGFHAAWLVEHHFMPGYSHSAAPDLFLAAAAQRTRRLRLGHAIIPLPFHHPLQVAERAATLDLLSGGRVELGVGRGFSPQEYATFGADMATSRERMTEALAVLRRALAEGRTGFAGTHFRFQDLPLVPRPLQRPHPPLWSAAVSPESFTWAADQGIGVLVGPFKPWFMSREDIRRYRAAWRKRHGDGPPGAGQNRAVGLTLGVHCLADGRQARREAAAGLTWFYHQLLEQTRPVLEGLYAGYEYYRKVGRLAPLLTPSLRLPALEAMGLALVGDPAHCLGRLQALSAAGVNRVLCAVGAGVLPTARVRESLEVLATRVMPHLPAREQP
jgi:alkanesulfonate monooxygenase SsuD/methylene tetrahydromethanopterin reductase-like flavin-dependent oxidoreductase (luciferase family)